MKTVPVTALLFACATCVAQSASAPAPAPTPSSAAAAAPARPAPAPASATDRGEPNVKHTVIEDDGSRIEELRVRGQTQRVVVTSKVGGGHTSYEIIMGNAGRNPVASTGGATSAVGKSVWSVATF